MTLDIQKTTEVACLSSSHESTISTVDLLGKDHDAVVCQWRDKLHNSLCNHTVST